ncbi:hypothetical protein Zmor_015507 [Zophobas morio]|uniref:Peptidase S1 domain-containing protein n=1 Tax=Zophobas morio TaxID=2755281 RepID=A0AA38IM81_9CUCU|nr:hypothetical protein Zmor_015507 [Zophobas morio]
MNNFVSSIFIFSSLFICVYAKTPSFYRHNEPRVIGGQDAYSGQFTFAAAIYTQTPDTRFFCGGALLSTEWILTAGHCVNNGIIFTIKLGSITLNSDDPNRVIVASSEYVLHPDFNPESIENDIGLIKLRLPITLTTYIQPTTLPIQPLYNYTTVTVLGWGQTSDYDPELSDNLKFVYVASISNAECRMIYGSQISDNMVCVQGNYNQGTCTGDNGGALIEYLGRYPYLVGIASFVSANGCESTNPSGYTRTFPFTEWIKSVIDI